MNFETWRATRRQVDDLSQHPRLKDMIEGHPSGYVYESNEADDSIGFIGEAGKSGYELELPGGTYYTDVLEDAERRLYAHLQEEYGWKPLPNAIDAGLKGGAEALAALLEGAAGEARNAALAMQDGDRNLAVGTLMHIGRHMETARRVYDALVALGGHR